MHPFGRWLACGILGLVLAVEAHGQEDVRYDADAEQAFQAAVQAYRGGAYRSAERQFDSVARAFPSSHRITAALVMRAKALFRLEENYEAVKAVRAFLAAHPASLYVPDAEVVLARVYLRINREEEARDAALRALHSLPEAPSGRLEQEVEAVLDTALSAVDLPALQTLIARTSGRRERGQLWRVVADRELSRGNARAAAVASGARALVVLVGAVRRIDVHAAEVRDRVVAGAVVAATVTVPLPVGVPVAALVPSDALNR